MMTRERGASKKVALFGVGSRGDVQPYVALGTALQNAGHDVTLACMDPYRQLVESAGLGYFSLGPMPGRFGKRDNKKEIPLEKVRRKDSSSRFDGVLGRMLFWGIFPRLIEPRLERFVEACEGVDAVLYSRLAIPVPHIAEAWGCWGSAGATGNIEALLPYRIDVAELKDGRR